MLNYSVKNTSAFCVLVGIMLLIIGFNGIMAHKFSSITEYIEGARIARADKYQKYLNTDGKVCIISTILADDAFFMPDTKQQKVAGGMLKLTAVWPDGSQNILIDWHKQSRLTKFPIGDSALIEMTPSSIEYSNDTASVSANLITTIDGNTASVSYFGKVFKLSGCKIKGIPQIKLQRKTICEGEKVAVILSKAESRNKNICSYSIQNVIPYDTAIKRETKSGAITFYIIVMAIGIIMFFIPERTTINPITAKSIVNKIINSNS